MISACGSCIDATYLHSGSNAPVEQGRQVCLALCNLTQHTTSAVIVLCVLADIPTLAAFAFFFFLLTSVTFLFRLAIVLLRLTL